MRNFFNKNRNDLSRLFYDLSKGVILSYVAFPLFQRSLNWRFGLVGSLVAVVALAVGMSLKKE